MKQVINAHTVSTSRCPSHSETHVDVVGGGSYRACTPPGMSMVEHIGNLIGDSFYGSGVDMYHPVSYTRPDDAAVITAAAQAAQKILDDAYAASVALAKEAEQLLMKKEMLENPILMWEPGLQETLTTETNKEIVQYNYTMGIQDTGQAEARRNEASDMTEKITDTVKKSAMIPILIIIGVLVALGMFIFRRN